MALEIDMLSDSAKCQEKSISVMQPYFFPYAGYFRLFAGVDQFVIFDCVQFPRRGRVHRTEVPGPLTAEWLTLPLAAQPRDVLIHELLFAAKARAAFDLRLRRLTWLRTAKGPAAEEVRAFLYAPLPSVMDYLEAALRLVTQLLGLEISFVRSSTLGIDTSLRAQNRVIAIASALGATRYVSAPGGRKLYDPRTFQQAGLELAFLQPYRGPFFQILPSLMTEDPDRIREDVIANLQFDVGMITNFHESSLR